MRARNIKPGFFKNDRLGEVEPLARLLYIGLWCLADREGRLADRPRQIKAEILPYDDCRAEELLEELHRRGFILRYAAGNESYIWIPAFRKHQNPHPREAASVIPAPPQGTDGPATGGDRSGRGHSDPGRADSLNPESLIGNPDDDRRPSGSESGTVPGPGGPEGKRPGRAERAVPGPGGPEGKRPRRAKRTVVGGAGSVAAAEGSLAALEAHFKRSSGKRTVNAGDVAAMRQALALAGGDPAVVRAVMDEAYRLFKPKFASDRIVSFAYFLPVLEHHLQRRTQAGEGMAAEEAGAAKVPFDPAADAALTAELLQLLDELGQEGPSPAARGENAAGKGGKKRKAGSDDGE